MRIQVIESQNPFYWSSLFTQFTKIYSLEIWLDHVMVFRKIGTVNVQLVQDNFATWKYYDLKLSARKFITLNFQLVKSKWQFI